MTFEELEAYLREGGKWQFDRERDGYMRYAEENGDEWLKRAVLAEYDGGERVPWGRSMVMEFAIGKSKVVVNREAKTMKGPKRIIKEIEEANERWRGVRDPKHDTDNYEDMYLYVAPGNLWNFYALIPLIKRLYGDDVRVNELETYPQNPLHELQRKLGWVVESCY